MYPSVTQILRPWSDFSNISPETLANAADRGSRVHTQCAAKAHGLFYIFQGDTLPYLASYDFWLEKVKPKIIATEIELCDHSLGFMGHPDLICQIGSEVIVIDLKTPAAVSPTWRLQLAAYHHLAKLHGYRPSRIAALRLSKDGKPSLFDEFTATVNTDFAIFLNCLSAYKYFYGDKPND